MKTWEVSQRNLKTLGGARRTIGAMNPLSIVFQNLDLGNGERAKIRQIFRDARARRAGAPTGADIQAITARIAELLTPAQLAQFKANLVALPRPARSPLSGL